MTKALAFDIYGTLIDPHGVVEQLDGLIGADAVEFSRVWREKQLEYTWRRGLMGCYADFGVCTRQALEYTNRFFATGMNGQTCDALMQAYRTLPAFDDVNDSLKRLRDAGIVATTRKTRPV